MIGMIHLCVLSFQLWRLLSMYPKAIPIFYFFLPNRTLDWFKRPQEVSRDDTGNDSVWYDKAKIPGF